MFFIFDIETIPDFEFLRRVLNQPDLGEEELLLQASEELTRNNS